MKPEATLEALLETIVEAFPEHASAGFTLLTAGWDCIAVDVDDRLIFKFPRHEEARRALAAEAGLLAIIRPAVTMPVPDLALWGDPPRFSHHAKLAGEHLVAAQYALLPDGCRDRLAADMALFYAELHRLPAGEMEAAGAAPVEAWLQPADILRRIWPVLPPDLRSHAERTIATWQDLPPDPHGTTYGFFDGHGWNMAFDHGRGRLNGIYDFGDSGFGDLHQECIYSNWIAPDLTARIIARYEGLTGRALDRRRVALLTGAHRLSELAQLAQDPHHLPMALRSVTEWAACPVP